MIMNSS